MESKDSCDLASWYITLLVIHPTTKRDPCFHPHAALISGHILVFLAQCFCTCLKIVSPQTCLDYPLII